MNEIPPNGAMEEYRMTGENIRHQDQIFFANMTVFVTLTVATIAFLFDPDKSIPSWLTLAGEFAGVLFAGVFWMSSSVYLYRAHHFYRRARFLEEGAPELKGFRQYSHMAEATWDAPRVRWLRPGSLAWHTLFLSAIEFWSWRGSVDLGLRGWVLPVGLTVFGVPAALIVGRRVFRRADAVKGGRARPALPAPH